jgi:hypothetical protein
METYVRTGIFLVTFSQIQFMKLRRSPALVFILVLALAYGCAKSCPTGDDIVEATLYDYTGLDGCTWVIQLENGEVLEPNNIKAFNFKLIDGKKVWVKYSIVPDQASICMVGQIVNIEGIWDR